MDTVDHSLPSSVVEVLRLIGRKWAIQVLHSLEHGAYSFGELKEEIKGVSASVLSDLLNEFINKEIIEKRSISVSPPRSTYHISSFGAVLCEIIDSITKWGEELASKKSGVTVSVSDSV